MKRLTHTLLLIVTMLVVAGCGSIAHVRELREAQAQFNQIAGKHNQDVTLALYPTDQLKGKLDADKLTLSSSPADTLRLAEQYRALALQLGALVKNKGTQLKSDRLYVRAKVLELTAAWQASYQARLYEIAYKSHSGTVGGYDDVLDLADARRNMRAFKRELKSDLLVSPLERFFVDGFDARARYDSAVLRAVAYSRRGELRKLAPVTEVVEAMAAAEKQLADEANDPAIQPLVAVVRYTMLVTACRIVQDSGVHKPGGEIWSHADASAKLPTLTARRAELHADAFPEAGKVNQLSELMRKVGIKKATFNSFVPAFHMRKGR